MVEEIRGSRGAVPEIPRVSRREDKSNDTDMGVGQRVNAKVDHKEKFQTGFGNHCPFMRKEWSPKLLIPI